MTTKLLAVDDSKTMRKVLEITFAGEDFSTDIAANADEALQKMATETPRVVLVDAHLGSQSGYDLCERIKGQSPGTAVIVLSSKHRPYDQQRGSAAGADDHMDKPFDTQKLIDKVRSAVEKVASQPLAAPAAAAAPQAPIAQAPAPQAPSAPALHAPPARSAGPRPVASAAPRPAASAAPRPVAPAPSTPAAVPQAAPSAAPARPAAPIAAAATADMAAKLEGLGLDKAQIEGVLALSRDVVEQVVWEVVPVLAETLIKEEIARLTAE